MMLVEGDVRNYEAMMSASCETYLIAMEAIVTGKQIGRAHV